MKLGLISFAAPPATGGGAVYVELLAQGVQVNDEIDEFHFFSERQADTDRHDPLDEYPGVRSHRVFITRATKTVSSARAYVAFGIQQLEFIRVAARLRKLKLDGLLIHSDIARRPSLIWLVAKAARSVGTLVALDVRDIGLVSSRARVLSSFDLVFACGEGPRQHIESISDGAVTPHVIPVPFVASTAERDGEGGREILERLGVSEDQPFILMTGGLTPAKGPVAAAETALELLQRPDGALPIVCCGPERMRHATIDLAREKGALLYAGRVTREAHLDLVRSAACVASFSIQEGLPRTILEAMAADSVFFAPTCVPEFAELPHLTGSAEARADLIVQAIKDGSTPYSYDLSLHDPAHVLRCLAGQFAQARSVDHRS